ncbi:hypothetical protein Nmel_010212 [Mimus melanotis]
MTVAELSFSDCELLSGNLSEHYCHKQFIIWKFILQLRKKELQWSFCRLSKDRQVLVVVTEQLRLNFCPSRI